MDGTSTSFVVDLSKIPDENHKEHIKKIILTRYTQVDGITLLDMINDGRVDETYYLVDYDNGNVFHCWVSRVEQMFEDTIDDLLHSYTDFSLMPKFNYNF